MESRRTTRLTLHVPEIKTLKLARGQSPYSAVPGFEFYGAIDDERRLVGEAYHLEEQGYSVVVMRSPAWLRREDPKTGMYFVYKKVKRRLFDPNEERSGWGGF